MKKELMQKTKIFKTGALVLLLLSFVLIFSACATQTQFKLDFIVNGEIYATIDTTGQETIELPANPAKEGYTFDGWYLDSGTWQKPFTTNSLLDAPLSSDMNVYAKFSLQIKQFSGLSFESQEFACDGTAKSLVVTGAPEGAIIEYTGNGQIETGEYFVTATVSMNGYETVVLNATLKIGPDLTGAQIISAPQFAINDQKLSLTLPNATESFSFIDQIIVSKNATWQISTDANGVNTIQTETVSLNLGDNTFYLLVTSGDANSVNLYTVVIRRRPIYTVSFYAENGTNIEAQQIEEGGFAKAPNNPTRTGYTFANWDYDFANPIVQDTSVTAVWRPTTYTITYNLNGGTNATSNPATYTIEDDTITFANPSRTGYDFAGWDNGEEKIAEIPEGSIGDFTLNAKWTLVEYTAKFYADGVLIGSTTFTIERKTINAPAVPHKVGYTGKWESFSFQPHDLKINAIYNELSYGISYLNTKSASNSNPVKYTVNTKDISLVALPDISGYTFSGWLDENGSPIEKIQTSELRSRKITAKWDLVTYTITYQDVNGQSNSNPDTYSIESDTITLSPLPDTDGYRFNGWKDENGNTVTHIAKGSYGEKTLIADWEINTYTITWKNYDGSVLKTDTLDFGLTPSYNEAKPTRENDSLYRYTFRGWSPEVVPVTGSTTYIAQFSQSLCQTFTVQYDAKGGTGAPSKQTKKSGQTITLSDTIPTKSGQIFMGWDCVYDGNNYQSGASFSVDANVTLYAVWGHNCATCNGTGGFDCAICSGKGSLECSNCNGAGKIRYGTMCSKCSGSGKILVIYCSGCRKRIEKPGSLAALTTFTCSSCGSNHFYYNGATINDAFFTCSSCGGTGGWEYSSCSSCRSTGKISCTSCNATGKTPCTTCNGAKIIKDTSSKGYSVTLKSGSTTVATVSLSYGNPYKLSTLTKTGYTFLGWFDSQVGGVPYTDQFGVCLHVWNLSQSKTLYAQWKLNVYNIRYNHGDLVDVEGLPTTYTVEDKDILLPHPTREHYQFVWQLDGTAVTMIDTALAKNITVKASWVPVNYPITYVLNGGTNAVRNPSVYTVESNTITFANPTKNGYNFTGWDIPQIPSGSAGDIIVTASWSEPVVYTITYDLAGGKLENNPNPTTYTVKTPTFTITGTPTRELEENLIFTGWSSTTIQEGSYGNITITALYDEIFTVSGNTITGVNTVAKGMTSIQIPGKINGVAVTSIGDSAFSGCTKLTSITMPDSVTSIGSSAFKGCTNLLSITIPDSVTSIGSSAFYNCYHLVEVHNLSALTITAGNSGNGYVGCYAKHVYKDGESYLHTTADSFVFYDDGTNVYLVQYNGTEIDLVLPETYNGKSYAINQYAFYYCTSSLTSVTIPDSVTSIGDYAFYYRTSLTSITIPDSVTSIGDSAFWGCKSLTNVTIGNSVTGIGEDAFRECTSLKSVTIPDSVTSIGDSAFRGCTSLKSVTIPDSVMSIGRDAFYDCTSLESMTIPDSVTSIGNSAFYDCKSLTSVTIPDSVTSIGEYAFSHCNSLTSITIPNSVTSIGKSAFYQCSKLTNISIPFVGATKSGTTNNYFGYIFGASEYNKNPNYIPSSLKTVIITAGTSIGDYAFYGCSNLTSMTFGNSVISIGDYAFYECESLTSVTFGKSSQLASIGSAAFCWCSKMTSITIPNSVTSIGTSAFSNCTSLTSVTFGKSSQLASIGGNAFCSCSKLTNITIPNSVTSIGKSAFYQCSKLTNISIPFVGATKSGTTNNYFGYIFGASEYNKNPNYIPSSLKTVIITAGTSIGNYAFYKCTSLTSVTIPDSVTSIGNYAFYDCKSLTSVTIGNSVTSIGRDAFYDCKSLTSATIPDSVTSIGEHAFSGCTSLQYTIYNNAKYLGNANNPYVALIYATNTSIVSYNIHSNTKVICGSAFSGCTSLKSITIPDSVASIGEWAFYDCKSLTSVTIGNSVTSIGEYAFSGCTSLTSVTFANTSGWYVTKTSGASSGTNMTVTNPSTNANNLTSNYCFDYYWYRK